MIDFFYDIFIIYFVIILDFNFDIKGVSIPLLRVHDATHFSCEIS